jgi:HK97 family phage major capsid protein
MAVQQGQPDRLLGYPVNINNDMPSTLATGVEIMLFGALAKYVVRIAGDVQLLRSDDLYILNHQSVFLGFQRADGNLVDTTAVKALSLA